MKHKIILPALLLVTLSFSYCKKDKSPEPDNPYGLPNGTQTGRGIFACRINGVNSIAKPGVFNVHGGIHNDTLGVRGKFSTGAFFNFISLGIYGQFNLLQQYNLQDTIHTYCFFATDSTCNNAGAVANIYPNNGTIVITHIDTTHPNTTLNVISGTFSFEVPIPGCDTLNVTDGRFDVVY